MFSTADVWWACRSAAGDHLTRFVSAEDLARIGRLRRLEDRQRGLVGWALVRLLLAEHLDSNPASIAVSRTCRSCGCTLGKPFVVGEPDLDFSISHAGDHVVVGIAVGAAIGVDVEAVSPVIDGLETMILSADDAAESIDELTRIWVRKEAVVKAIGTGLRTPMSSFGVSRPDAHPALLTWPNDPQLVGGSSLVDLSERAGYRAAAAILRPGAPVTEHDGVSILSAGGLDP